MSMLAPCTRSLLLGSSPRCGCPARCRRATPTTRSTPRSTRKHKIVKGHEQLTGATSTSGAADRAGLSPLHERVQERRLDLLQGVARATIAATTPDKHGWGAIDVTQARRRRCRSDRAAARSTTRSARSTLPAPIAAGATVEIDVEFTTQLPKVFARTGYQDDFFAVGAVVPQDRRVFARTARPSGACRWRAHQHHLNREFFADFGVYDVDVEVPQGLVVGATGVLTAEKLNGERKTLTLPRRGRARLRRGPPRPSSRRTEDKFTDATGDVRIVCCRSRGARPTSRATCAPRATGSPSWRDASVRIPTRSITVVDVPDGAEGAGGMEYPTLFSTDDLPVPRRRPPPRVRDHPRAVAPILLRAASAPTRSRRRGSTKASPRR